MIIQSTSVLSQPESAVFVHLGEYSQGYVYKTDSLSAVQAANPGSEITEVPSESMPSLRKVLYPAVRINIETHQKIRAKYSVEGEIQAIRTNDQEYKTFIEQVVAEHNAAKDALFSL